MTVNIGFNTKSKIGFFEDSGKLSWYVTDVVKGETVRIFEDIIRASTTKLYLMCLDGQTAFVKLDDLEFISIDGGLNKP